MLVSNYSSFEKGCFIGNFEPSLVKTPIFEWSTKFHREGEFWPQHKHEQMTEYNHLVQGVLRMDIDGEEYWIEEGQIFVVERGEVAKPHFITDCIVSTIKMPSVPGDKVIV